MKKPNILIFFPQKALNGNTDLRNEASDVGANCDLSFKVEIQREFGGFF